MSTQPVPFHAYLRIVRQVKGLSYAQVEQQSGISKAYLWHLEQGRSSPTIAMLKRLAKAYGMKPETLLQEAARSEP